MVDPDGPLISGRPILTLETVQAWFADAQLEIPSAEAVGPIACAINHLDLFQVLWKDDPALREWRENAPTKLKQIRLAQAVDAICSELPSLIQSAEAYRPDGDYESYKSLLSSARICMPYLRHLIIKRRGRSPENWHNVARTLRDLFIVAAKTTERSRDIGFGQPTSRGIPLLRSALLRLELDKTGEQIVDALRPPRKRRRGGK